METLGSFSLHTMRFSSFIFVVFLLCACENESETEKLYSLLQVCHDEFYLDYGVKASDSLRAFESHLIEQKLLFNNSPTAYKTLFRKLSKELYFKPPLPMDNFNNALLYRNPEDLFECMEETFHIDSSAFIHLSYYKASKQIREVMLESEEVPVQSIFEIYASQINEEEYAMPYVKDALLLFLYRWYFTSKYDRSIPIEIEEE